MIHDFIPDDTFTEKLYAVITGMYQQPSEGNTRFHPSRPGIRVMANRLRAEFSRTDNGQKRIIMIEGTAGELTRAEEERLYAAWLAAKAAWDRGER